ncbi:zinc-binding protein A33-like [Protopterus annectens]|uniref:zinc-binding protein A33-like n=1 Tax=Protopterus annectens TaxID=7888 RepID=UPI001CFC42DD|nr:zinc-binding protein A33-like [Protopterus annectens]
MTTNLVTEACNNAEDYTCYLCKELFKKPVILDCGHNYCKSCIDNAWDNSVKDPACPECREEFKSKKYTVNWLLAKQVAALNLSSGSTDKGTGPLHKAITAKCLQHEENLKLFCREDETLICIICRDSTKHSGHSFLPLDEAVIKYQDKMTTVQVPLETALQKLAELQAQQKKKITDVKDHARRLEQHIKSQFAELHQFLEERKQCLTKQLKNEKEEILRMMKYNLKNIKEETTIFEKSLLDIRSQMAQQDAVTFLTELKNLSESCSKAEQLASKSKNDVISGEFSLSRFKGPLQYRVWKEMKSIIDPGPRLICQFRGDCHHAADE